MKACSIYVSNDGKSWGEPLMKGALKPKVCNEQKIMFPAPTDKKLIRFEVTDAVLYGGQPIAAIGELDVLVKKPAFLAHAYDDKICSIKESTLYADKLFEYRVPVEMHLFTKGGHGFGTGRREDGTDQWVPLFVNWLKNIDL